MSDHDFNTPPEILDLIRRISPKGRIGLDPCSNAFSLVDAGESYTIEDDGLAQSWRGHGMVFVNPPHSPSPFNIEPWMLKAYQEFIENPLDRDTIDCLTMLVPAKTDTAWFHDQAAHFAARCFLRGRPRFWHHGIVTPGPGKFASMVIYHGPCVGHFMHTFQSKGWLA